MGDAYGTASLGSRHIRANIVAPSPTPDAYHTSYMRSYFQVGGGSPQGQGAAVSQEATHQGYKYCSKRNPAEARKHQPLGGVEKAASLLENGMMVTMSSSVARTKAPASSADAFLGSVPTKREFLLNSGGANATAATERKAPIPCNDNVSFPPHQIQQLTMERHDINERKKLQKSSRNMDVILNQSATRITDSEPVSLSSYRNPRKVNQPEKPTMRMEKIAQPSERCPLAKNPVKEYPVRISPKRMKF